MFKKIGFEVICMAALIVCGIGTSQAVPVAADVVFIVDESGSMSTEHAWLSTMVTDMETGLIAKGVGGGATTNKYALVGYGASPHGTSQLGHKHSVGGGDWGSASQLATATSGLVVSGGTEDGYEAINFFLNNYTWRTGVAALNIILVTDEDRDIRDSTLTKASIEAAIRNVGGLLNVVVNNPFTDSLNNTALGVDSEAPTRNAYLADGSGDYTKVSGGIIGNGFGTTETDYVALALALGGASWDLNQLRAGGNTATSFTKAFVDIKVEEVLQQPPSVLLPEPATLLLMGIGLVGIGYTKRRQLFAKRNQ